MTIMMVAIAFASAACGGDRDTSTPRTYDRFGLSFQYPGVFTRQDVNQSATPKDELFADAVGPPSQHDNGVFVFGYHIQALEAWQDGTDIPDDAMNELAATYTAQFRATLSAGFVHVHVGQYPALRFELDRRSYDDVPVHDIAYYIFDVTNLQGYDVECQSTKDHDSMRVIQAACDLVTSTFAVVK